jgi:hypothetical protein
MCIRDSLWPLSVQDEVEVIGVMDIACRLARPSAA